jgi:hypothetical protein
MYKREGPQKRGRDKGGILAKITRYGTKYLYNLISIQFKMSLQLCIYTMYMRIYFLLYEITYK